MSLGQPRHSLPGPCLNVDWHQRGRLLPGLEPPLPPFGFGIAKWGEGGKDRSRGAPVVGGLGRGFGFARTSAFASWRNATAKKSGQQIDANQDWLGRPVGTFQGVHRRPISARPKSKLAWGGSGRRLFLVVMAGFLSTSAPSGYPRGCSGGKGVVKGVVARVGEEVGVCGN